jgi:hypothetical protein
VSGLLRGLAVFPGIATFGTIREPISRCRPDRFAEGSQWEALLCVLMGRR